MDNVPTCSHCCTENPVGGITEYRYEAWVLEKRPGFREYPTYQLCEVCRNLLGAVGNINLTDINHGLKDQATMTNIIRKDIAALAAKLGVRS